MQQYCLYAWNNIFFIDKGLIFFPYFFLQFVDDKHSIFNSDM